MKTLARGFRGPLNQQPHFRIAFNRQCVSSDVVLLLRAAITLDLLEIRGSCGYRTGARLILAASDELQHDEIERLGAQSQRVSSAGRSAGVRLCVNAS